MEGSDAAWTAGGMGLVGLGYGAVKLVAYARSRWFSQSDHEGQTAYAREKERRRDASDEAWAVADKVAEQNVAERAARHEAEARYEKMLDISEERERECSRRLSACEAELAATQATLRMVVAWARAQKNPLPFPMDEPPSAVHRALAAQPPKPQPKGDQP